MTKVMPTSCCKRFSSSCIAPRSFLSSARERLVEEQHPRPLDEGAGERDALLLAAGELVGLAGRQLRKVRRGEDRGDARVDLVAGEALHLQAIGDVGAHRHMREQRVGLEHEVDGTAIGRDAAQCRRRRGGCAPPSGVSKPASMRRSVVLPQPEGPSRAKNSFSRMSSETPSTATAGPKRLVTRSMARSVRGAVMAGQRSAVDALGEDQRGDADRHDNRRERVDLRRDAEADHGVDLHGQRGRGASGAGGEEGDDELVDREREGEQRAGDDRRAGSPAGSPGGRW